MPTPDTQIAANRKKLADDFQAHFHVSWADYLDYPLARAYVDRRAQIEYHIAHPKPKAAPRPKRTAAEIAAAKAVTQKRYRQKPASRAAANQRQNAKRAARHSTKESCGKAVEK